MRQKIFSKKGWVNTGFHVFVTAPRHYISRINADGAIHISVLTWNIRLQCSSNREGKYYKSRIPLSLVNPKIFPGGMGPGFSFPSGPMVIKHIYFSRIKKEAMIDFRVPFAILNRS
jgi:hypothetical protein